MVSAVKELIPPKALKVIGIKGDSSRLTLGTMGSELSGLPHQQRVALGCGSTLESCLLKRGKNGKVESRWMASGPIRQEDICRVTMGAWNKRGNLLLRSKDSSLGSRENRISNTVVVVNSVRIVAEPNLMITIRVSS